MEEVLDIHNSNPLDVDMICEILDAMGYKAEYEARISRTLMWSDAPQAKVDKVVDFVWGLHN